MASLKFAVIVDTSATDIFEKYDSGRIGSSKAPLGGIELYEALGSYLRSDRHFLVDRLSLERAILEVGSAVPESQERAAELVGRNIDNGLPTRFQVKTNEVQKAIEPIVRTIVQHITYQITFRITASPFSSIDDEVLLSGNFGGLRGLDTLLQQELRAKNFPEAIVVKKFCDVFDC